MSWGEDLADWWIEEVATDPVYRGTIVPMALDLIRAEPGERWLDLGCGEGRMMREVARTGARLIGCDASASLAGRALSAGPVVRARLPELGWLQADAVDGAFAVLVVEHLERLDIFLAETARVVRGGGALVVVANHPVVTSPGSAPVVDLGDGETLWRWGPYLREGSSAEPAGGRSLTFHHRPLGVLLTMAAGVGWMLTEAVELGIGPAAGASVPAGHEHIPRLLGVRWTRA